MASVANAGTLVASSRRASKGANSVAEEPRHSASRCVARDTGALAPLATRCVKQARQVGRGQTPQ